MLPLTVSSFRLFLHVTAATVWVGGQLTLLGLLPVLRSLGPDATRAAARRFNLLAWIAFGVLIVTGVWNLLAESVGDRTTAWHATLGLKLLLVALTGIAAALHATSSERRVIAIGGAVGLLTGLGAVWTGILLAGG